MQGHTLLNARFLNNDRTTLLAEWKDNNDETVIRNQYMEAKDNNAQYRELLNHTTLDDIYEYTVNYERDYREGYEKFVLALAKKEGLVYEADLNPEFYSDIVKFIFEGDETGTLKEKLFLLKLKMFEDVEAIRKSKNVRLKSKLRKSKTAYEAIKSGIEIYEESKQQ